MSENGDLVRSFYEHLTRGAIDAAFGLLAVDCRLEFAPEFPESGVFVGVDDAQHAVQEWLDSFSELEFEIERLVDRTTDILAILRVCGIGRESGASVIMGAADWWVFRGTQPVELRVSADVEGTLGRFTDTSEQHPAKGSREIHKST